MEPNPSYRDGEHARGAYGHDARRDNLVQMISLSMIYAVLLPVALPVLLFAFAVFAVVDLIVYQRAPWTLFCARAKTMWRLHRTRGSVAAARPQLDGASAESAWQTYRAWLLLSVLVFAVTGAGIGVLPAAHAGASTATAATAYAAAGAAVGGLVIWPLLVLCAQLPRVWRMLRRGWGSLDREHKLLAGTIIGSIVIALFSAAEQHRHRRR